MTVLPQGNYNNNALTVPGLYIQVVAPQNGFINGIPSNILGLVGTASWGPVNSPVSISTVNDYMQNFGPVLTNKYDMGTHVALACLQQANNISCVRVTDGTDTAASVALVDTNGSPATGLTLNSFYTGAYGNLIQAVVSAGTSNTNASPSFKLTISVPNGVPEIFDNIGGTGSNIWANMTNAVNLGQGSIRPPSVLCTASLATYISSVSITAAGSYATLPTFGTTGDGSGATFAGTMKAVSAVMVAAGTGYVQADTITLTGGTHTVNAILTVQTTQIVSLDVNAGGSNYQVGDTITLAGGTHSTAAILTVATVSSGAVSTFTISNVGSYSVNASSFTQGATSGVGTGATFNTVVWGVNTASVTTVGAYTALPSSPVAQGSTSGSGSGATFTMFWGVASVAVTAGGSGYDSTSAFSVTGGGGSGGALGTLAISSLMTPALSTYTLSGGTNGITGVSDSTVIGQDTVPRKGMYALRGSGASVIDLCDVTGSSTFTTQVAYGLSEGAETIMVGPAGQTIAQAGSVKQSVGVNSYAGKVLIGDWIYWQDTYNNVLRLVSPQAPLAGAISYLNPAQSDLNYPLQGIVATQTTFANQTYSPADMQNIASYGLDVIYNPSPGGNYFAAQFGRNTSSNPAINGDNYTRLTNFIAYSLNAVMGQFVGQLQTPSLQLAAQTTLSSFLANLQAQGMIGTSDGSPAYQVILNSSNNPQSRVALGYMQADVSVVYLSVVQYFVINLQGGQTVSIQTLNTVPVAA
jgi:hypothetical protein